MTRTAREVVELYNLVVWNEKNFDLVEELFADTVIRHDVEEVTTLTHDQAVQRVEDSLAMFDKLLHGRCGIRNTRRPRVCCVLPSRRWRRGPCSAASRRAGD
jgi:hypothetical protein